MGSLNSATVESEALVKARQGPTISLPVEHAQEILSFLASCPYAQVHQLVGYLLAADQANMPQPVSVESGVKKGVG